MIFLGLENFICHEFIVSFFIFGLFLDGLVFGSVLGIATTF
jgi:hypothetical protein